MDLLSNWQADRKKTTFLAEDLKLLVEQSNAHIFKLYQKIADAKHIHNSGKIPSWIRYGHGFSILV